jgi:hypothetical protein
MTPATPSALDAEFTATVVRSPAPGGWTYVQMSGSACKRSPALSAAGRVEQAGPRVSRPHRGLT